MPEPTTQSTFENTPTTNTTVETFVGGHPVRMTKKDRGKTAHIVCVDCGHWHELEDGVKESFGETPCDPEGDHAKHYSVRQRILNG